MTIALTGFTGPQYYNDCAGPAYFSPFAVDLATRLPERPPGDVLEIACGTGLVTRGLRQRLSPASKLVATDLNKTMLDYARSKLADLKDIEWQEADALKLPFADKRFGAVVCGFGIMFVPDRQAALIEARRVLADGGLLIFNVWDRIEANAHALANAEAVEAMFPNDPEMRFRIPYDMCDPVLLRGLLAGARFRETRIETKRLPIAGDARSIAIGQIRGTPRSALIEKRGVSLDLVINKVTEALTKAGADPYSGHAQAVVVEAVAV
jgi:SAM-dependent methyltransferase